MKIDTTLQKTPVIFRSVRKLVSCLQMCPICVGAVDNFGKSYENKLRSTLDQWFKLVHLNAQPEIQILNWLYP